jgi:hypothetical protein
MGVSRGGVTLAVTVGRGVDGEAEDEFLWEEL